jgi:exocyst complex component 1
MHHFVAEMSAVQLGSVVSFTKRAEALYDENLTAYVKLILRRPFAKIIVRIHSSQVSVIEMNILLGLL